MARRECFGLFPGPAGGLHAGVAAVQQRLFPDPQPLVERLGREFFRRLPATPGVYLMHGPAEAVLYVGKAKNLRHRLGNYRVANPERMPRRTLRLLRLAERITWEECPDEAAALRREAELLLALKPRFNRAGVWPRPRRFLAWRTSPEGLELAVTETPEPGWDWHGPTGGQAVPVHRALVRLFWCRLQPARGLAGMPAGWMAGAHGLRVVVPAERAAAADAVAFLSQLASGSPVEGVTTSEPADSSFERDSREADWTTVREHFARGQIVAAEA